MKTRKRSSMSKPTDQQAQQLCDAIHSLGDYEHVSVRAERGPSEHLHRRIRARRPFFLRSVAASTASVSASTPDAGNLCPSLETYTPSPTISSLHSPHISKNGILPTGKAGPGTSLPERQLLNFTFIRIHHPDVEIILGLSSGPIGCEEDFLNSPTLVRRDTHSNETGKND